jgi:5-methylcytosine-specific restriction endonuclease McrA
MSVTVEDLPELIGAPGPRPLLLCRCCGGEFSANKSDYFWMPAGDVFECCECGEPLELVTKHVVYRPAGRASRKKAS